MKGENNLLRPWLHHAWLTLIKHCQNSKVLRHTNPITKTLYHYDNSLHVDGESQEYTVSAESFEDAAREAESLAYSDGIQISFMNINAF